jgi:hypothetical protein
MKLNIVTIDNTSHIQVLHLIAIHIRKDFHRHHFQGLTHIENLLMCYLLL